jgi:hypothetical protein
MPLTTQCRVESAEPHILLGHASCPGRTRAIKSESAAAAWPSGGPTPRLPQACSRQYSEPGPSRARAFELPSPMAQGAVTDGVAGTLIRDRQ